MGEELDERAIGTGTPFIAMVHMPSSPGDPGLITARCCTIIAIKKKLNTNLPNFADAYELHAVPLGAKPIVSLTGSKMVH